MNIPVRLNIISDLAVASALDTSSSDFNKELEVFIEKVKSKYMEFATDELGLPKAALTVETFNMNKKIKIEVALDMPIAQLMQFLADLPANVATAKGDERLMIIIMNTSDALANKQLLPKP